MKKFILAGVILLVLVNLGAVAWRMGWLARLPVPGLASLAPVPAQSGPAPAPGTPQPAGDAASPPTTPAAAPASSVPPAASSPAAAGAAAGAPAGSPAAPATDATGAALIPPPAFDGNVASPDWGGTVETWSTEQLETPDGQMLIAGRKDSRWNQFERRNPRPAHAVISFFGREPVLVDRVILAPINNPPGLKAFPKDVEVWASMDASPEGAFQKVVATSLPPVTGDGQGVISFGPVEARFLKVSLLNNQAGTTDFSLTNAKVMEAQRPGYKTLLERHPELLWPGGPNAWTSAGPQAKQVAGCQALPAAQAPPKYPESRNVLLLGEWRNMHLAGVAFMQPRHGAPDEPSRHRVEFKLPEKGVGLIEDHVPPEERGVLSRATFRFLAPRHARPAILAPAFGFDTVVMAQMCNGSPRMATLSPAFKQALMAWVAAGHKLIIQDSDDCVPGPDYSFIPYRFKTDTPGARGAAGFNLRFVEANQMLQGRAGRPGFLDVDAWVQGARGYRNELGDANTFVAWDANWCGQLAVKNVNGVTGFALAYARLGRGLIIYDGFDNDQTLEAGYDQVAVRELAQPFDPDNLPCAARLGDFVVTTETSLLQRAAVAGRTYSYPLTLLSNQGYSGSVNLSAAVVGDVSRVETKFDPATVALNGEGGSGLTLTLPASLPVPNFAVEVKGSDAKGTSSSLCLQFAPPTSGELAVVSTLAPPTKTRKNLEIILDASGSMKTILSAKEKKTRWDVAVETLDQVLASLPNDFQVGLRMYGHREPSRSPKTCTDSQLLWPIRKLDRKGILTQVGRYKPKGETPLVYSALQAPADLKNVGGGTVILITDGEESCKGDMAKAAADLKASGLDIRLNIVGFALKKNAKVQKDLSGFAESTGGLFYAAEDGVALADALMVAAVDKFPYTVYDAQGKAVLSGDAGIGSDPLPPGDYKVVIKAGTKELVAPKVSLAAGQSVTLTIAMKAGQLVLQ
jgi:hypothetical protein